MQLCCNRVYRERGVFVLVAQRAAVGCRSVRDRSRQNVAASERDAAVRAITRRPSRTIGRHCPMPLRVFVIIVIAPWWRSDSGNDPNAEPDCAMSRAGRGRHGRFIYGVYQSGTAGAGARMRDLPALRPTVPKQQLCSTDYINGGRPPGLPSVGEKTQTNDKQ
jgi:hypothetical protein